MWIARTVVSIIGVAAGLSSATPPLAIAASIQVTPVPDLEWNTSAKTEVSVQIAGDSDQAIEASVHARPNLLPDSSAPIVIDAPTVVGDSGVEHLYTSLANATVGCSPSPFVNIHGGGIASVEPVLRIEAGKTAILRFPITLRSSSFSAWPGMKIAPFFDVKVNGLAHTSTGSGTYRVPGMKLLKPAVPGSQIGFTTSPSTFKAAGIGAAPYIRKGRKLTIRGSVRPAQPGSVLRIKLIQNSSRQKVVKKIQLTTSKTFKTAIRVPRSRGYYQLWADTPRTEQFGRSWRCPRSFRVR